MLFKECSKCNARVLKKVLGVHERFCYGAEERYGAGITVRGLEEK